MVENVWHSQRFNSISITSKQFFDNPTQPMYYNTKMNRIQE